MSDERRRSRLAVAAGRVARTTALAVVVLALIALRYWIYLPHFLHPSG